jgi:carbon-monoxide dehydrogenase small subunit
MTASPATAPSPATAAPLIEVTLRVNGIDHPVSVGVGRNLLSVIRSEVGLTGTKEGCDDCECGACMVLVDGRPVNSCSFLAVQAAGREITTIEGVMCGDDLHPLQRNLLDEGGVQCGYCTPGMIISATALLASTPDPTPEEIRIGLSGNLCRCTGYAKILAAVERTAAELAT